MKKAIIFMAFITLIIASCKNKKIESAAVVSDTIPVKTMLLQQQTTQQTIQVSGQFTTEDETFLSFKTGGIVNHILVKEGDAVHKGQLIATLNLTEINAQVQQAQIAHEKAIRDYKRVTNLYKDSVATLEQMQNVKTALDVAEQQLTAANFNKTYSEIKASTDGYVLKKLANDGQVVAPGTPILQINGAQNGNWVLKVGVSDREWSSIQKNDKAIIQTDASAESFPAFVSTKSEGVDAATGTFSISLKLTNQQSTKLAAGLFGKASIIPSQTIVSWTLPYDAILDGDEGTGYAFITNDNKTAEKVKIKINSIYNGKVLVTDGLQNAKAVIVSGNAYLDNHSPIQIIK